MTVLCPHTQVDTKPGMPRNVHKKTHSEVALLEAMYYYQGMNDILPKYMPPNVRQKTHSEVALLEAMYYYQGMNDILPTRNTCHQKWDRKHLQKWVLLPEDERHSPEIHATKSETENTFRSGPSRGHVLLPGMNDIYSLLVERPWPSLAWRGKK